MSLYGKNQILSVRERRRETGFQNPQLAKTKGFMQQNFMMGSVKSRQRQSEILNEQEQDLSGPADIVKGWQEAGYQVRQSFKNSVSSEYKVASGKESDMLYGEYPVAKTDISIDAENGVTGSKLGVSFAEELMQRLNLSPTVAAAWAGNTHHESAGFTAAREKDSKKNQGGRGFNMFTDMAVAKANRLTETQKQALSVDALLEKGLRRSAFKKWTKENNLKVGSIDADLGFIEYEIKNTREGNILEDLKGVTDINEAAKIISEGYYRPNKEYAYLDRRQGHATTIFDMMQKAVQGVK